MKQDVVALWIVGAFLIQFMNREIKFRGLRKDGKGMLYSSYVLQKEVNGSLKVMLINGVNWVEVLPESVGQYTGLKDANEEEYYIGDIGEFSNGDRFVLRMEEWLEVFVEWIGDPECEDQARDIYRIEMAQIIGNIYEHPELLK